MGGRGSFSYSGGRLRADSATLGSYAVAGLNSGTAKGTSPAAAVARFRERTMSEKFEYSAYIDEAGYIHSLGSTKKEGSTKVAPLSSVAKEKGVTTLIHNHPHGGSDGRKWGGPLSEADLAYVANAHRNTGGKVNRIIATSNEGTYSATVTRKVTDKQVKAAAKKADASLRGKKFQSEIGMWRAVNKAYTSEFAKIGIEITYTKQKKTSGRLVTQKTGTY